MKQKIKLSLTQKPFLVFDQIDMQTIIAGSERIAEKLVKKHQGNPEEIKKEVLALEVSEVRDFNFREEVSWAARWIAAVK